MALEVMNQAPKIIQINSSDLIKLYAFWFDPLGFSFTSPSCRKRHLTKIFKYLKSELGLLLMTSIHFSTLRRNQ